MATSQAEFAFNTVKALVAEAEAKGDLIKTTEIEDLFAHLQFIVNHYNQFK